MHIRLLQPGDELLHIQAVLLLIDGYAMTEARSAELLAEPTYIFIVALTDNGEMMGRIYGHVLYRFGQTDLLLYEVDVLENHQRKGVGRALLNFAKQFCSDRGYGESWVLTEGDKAPACSLYESTGGVEEDSPTIMYVYHFGA